MWVPFAEVEEVGIECKAVGPFWSHYVRGGVFCRFVRCVRRVVDDRFPIRCGASVDRSLVERGGFIGWVYQGGDLWVPFSMCRCEVIVVAVYVVVRVLSGGGGDAVA